MGHHVRAPGHQAAGGRRDWKPSSRHCSWLLLLLACAAPMAATARLNPGISETHSIMHPGDWEAGEQELFLFPVLLNGPYNQRRDIRSFAALAAQLDAKLMLTGVFKHHLDNRRVMQQRQLSSQTPEEAALPSCFPDAALGYMQFTDVMDREPFGAAPTVEELKARGWNGQLDAIVVDSAPGVYDKHAYYVYRSLALANVTLADDAPRVLIKSPMACSSSRLHALKAALKPFKYVAVVKVLLSSHVNPDLELEVAGVRKSSRSCEKSIHEANRMLRPAPWIRAAASAFARDKLGGNFVSMHVRPYPDTCLQAWQAGNATSGRALRQACAPALATLHDRLAPCAARAARRAGTRKVFLMTHPTIQPMVQSLLHQAGFTDIVTADSHDIARLAGCRDFSFTFLSMVEEEIAAQATQFIGTRSSSITQSLVFERLGAGNLNPSNSNAFWESMQC